MNATSSSIIEALPQNGITSFLGELNTKMGEILSEHIAQTPSTGFILANPLVILVLFFVVMGGFALFFDFIQDAWKLPFAIVVDVIDLMAISMFSTMNLAATAAAFLVFFFLTMDIERKRYLFGGIGALKCFLPIPILSMLPINTILMLIATIID
ncbi:MAG: hypothetical protein ACOC32_03070 [Nanoarchaeota archaeon]